MQDDLCPKCNKPKSSSSSGLVTQFIEICRCEALAEELSETISICSNCGMRIPRRSGSITQWIFGQGTCECEKPTPEERPIEEFINPSFVGFKDIDNELELELASDSFPIERYKPIAELGRGASGVVYLARDRLLGKKVAVKTLLDLTPEQLISFQDEAKATAKLDHPNIIKILDFGVWESVTPYMVMESVPGVSLESYLKKNGTLDEDIAVAVFSKLASALGYAHGKGVYHRDIKPSNIILFENEEAVDVCLIDFGIAKVKEASGLVTVYQDKTLAGTPSYMAPDTISGEEYDAKSEIYSLGCVLFESLVGAPPFSGETALETLALHAESEPQNLMEIDPNISEHISNIVSKCLSKKKSERFPDMASMGNALAESRAQPEIRPTTSTGPELNVKWLLSVIFIVGVGFAVFAWSALNEAENEVKNSKSKSAIETAEKSVIKEYTVLSDTQSKKFDVQALIIKQLESGGHIALMEYELSREALSPLKNAKAQIVRLLFCDVDEGALETLSTVKNVQTLVINNCNFKPSDLDYLAYVSKISSLKSLMLNFSEQTVRLDSLEIKNLSRLANLRKLTIESVDLDKYALQSLSSFNKLSYLALPKSPVDHHGLKSIAKCKNLQALVITVPEFEEEDLQVISKMPNLNSLSIHGSKITSAKPFMHFAKMPRLKNLDLQSSVLVSENSSGIEKLNLELLDLDAGKQFMSKIRGLKTKVLSLDGRKFNETDLHMIKIKNPKIGEIRTREGVGLENID